MFIDFEKLTGVFKEIFEPKKPAERWGVLCLHFSTAQEKIWLLEPFPSQKIVIFATKEEAESEAEKMRKRYTFGRYKAAPMTN